MLIAGSGGPCWDISGGAAISSHEEGVETCGGGGGLGVATFRKSQIGTL